MLSHGAAHSLSGLPDPDRLPASRERSQSASLLNAVCPFRSLQSLGLQQQEMGLQGMGEAKTLGIAPWPCHLLFGEEGEHLGSPTSTC